MTCTTPAGTTVPLTLSRLPSPDIAQHFQDPEATRQRFAVRLDTTDDCQITLTTAQQHTFQLNAILAGTQPVPLGHEQFHIDNATRATPHAEMPSAVRQGYALLLALYRYGMPLGAGLGVLAYVYALATSLRSKRLPLPLLIASMFWGLLVCRIALLILVDISSFPAIQVKYVSAGFLVFCLALLFSGVAARDVSHPHPTA